MGHWPRALTVAQLLYGALYGNNGSAQHGVETLKSLLSALSLPLIPPGAEHGGDWWYNTSLLSLIV